MTSLIPTGVDVERLSLTHLAEYLSSGRATLQKMVIRFCHFRGSLAPFWDGLAKNKSLEQLTIESPKRYNPPGDTDDPADFLAPEACREALSKNKTLRKLLFDTMPIGTNSLFLAQVGQGLAVNTTLESFELRTGSERSEDQFRQVFQNGLSANTSITEMPFILSTSGSVDVLLAGLSAMARLSSTKRLVGGSRRPCALQRFKLSLMGNADTTANNRKVIDCFVQNNQSFQLKHFESCGMLGNHGEIPYAELAKFISVQQNLERLAFYGQDDDDEKFAALALEAEKSASIISIRVGNLEFDDCVDEQLLGPYRDFAEKPNQTRIMYSVLRNKYRLARLSNEGNVKMLPLVLGYVLKMSMAFRMVPSHAAVFQQVQG